MMNLRTSVEGVADIYYNAHWFSEELEKVKV